MHANLLLNPLLTSDSSSNLRYSHTNILVVSCESTLLAFTICYILCWTCRKVTYFVLELQLCTGRNASPRMYCWLIRPVQSSNLHLRTSMDILNMIYWNVILYRLLKLISDYFMNTICSHVHIWCWGSNLVPVFLFNWDVCLYVFRIWLQAAALACTARLTNALRSLETPFGRLTCIIKFLLFKNFNL